MTSFLNRIFASVVLPMLIGIAVYRAASAATDWPAWLCKAVFLFVWWGAYRTARPYCVPKMDWGRTAWITVRLCTVAVLVVGTFCLTFTLSSPLASWVLNDLAHFLDPVKYHEIARYLFAALTAFLMYGAAKKANLPTKYDPTLRGRQLRSYDEAVERAKALETDDSRGIYRWGGLMLPDSLATTHFLVVGATGSGKTLTLKMLMSSVVAQMSGQRRMPMVVYDAKQDMVASLLAMGISVDKIKILHPFDNRCVAWDMAQDIVDPASVQQVAAILVPPDNDQNRFFTDAVRDILSGVLTALIGSGRAWTLRDVVLAMFAKREILHSFLHGDPTGHRFDAYFEDKRTYSNIRASINTKMTPYAIVAAAWEGRQKISLRQWIHGQFVLVLGNDEESRSALDAINQVMFKRMTELILSLPEVSPKDPLPPRTWIFLDEIREAGRLDGLSRLLTKGRSKGACVVLGFQDIEGMRDVYGQMAANELTGQCACKAVLKIDNPNTAEWASSLFGVAEVEKYSYSYGQNASTSVSVGERSLVLPSEIMDTEPASPENGLGGHYLIPKVGAYSHTIPWDQVAQELHLSRDEDRPRDDSINFSRRTGDYQTLRDWTEEEVRAWTAVFGSPKANEAPAGETGGTFRRPAG